MILDQIVADVRKGLAERKQQNPLAKFESLLDISEIPRNFKEALQGQEIKVIAEVKRASPSKGWLNPDLNVTELVQSYTQGGAAAISVLAEPDWFKGDLADLTAAHKATSLPLLYKGFIIDPYQVYEARASGADAVLLIVSLLSLSELSELMKLARKLGMVALIEVHSEPELKKALDAGARLIGINNRNLSDFSVDLKTTLKLRPLIPSDVTVVSESGIKSRADIIVLEGAGVNAVLVGEMLVISSNPEIKLRELRGLNGQG